VTGARPTLPATAEAKVIVSGILFFYPLAGVTYQFLHYVLGLRRLGYDVAYIEDSSRWVYDPGLNDLTPDARANVARVAPVLERFGLAGRWAYRDGATASTCLGMEAAELDRWYREADLFLNVTGAQEMTPNHLRVPVRAYVESDPFMFQVDVANGVESTRRLLDAHHHFFTFGENLGAPDCGIPPTPYPWKVTRQPVLVDLWDAPPVGDAGYRTVATWRNTGKDRVWDGEEYYWTKDREFRAYLDLPAKRDVPFEIAVSRDREANRLLPAHGWRTQDALAVSSDLDRYRRFVTESRAEFTVARDQYVRPRTGWFSDRSACFLAAGRPVITQETGFSRFLPTGKGLFAFDGEDDVLAAVDAIEADPVGHGRAAREVAREYFGADRVLADLMEELR
jgi:hypothetical protein